MSAQPETWRVSTVEGVFETDLETLKQWIVEGCVLPTDRVSKGNLNWIDAGRVPKLKAAFNGEIEPPPAPNTAFSEGGWQTPPSLGPAEQFEPPPGSSTNQHTQGASQTNVCQNHPGATPKYICRQCATALCADCPRFVGSTRIPVCPLCGDLCRSYSEVTSRVARADYQATGFGMNDFVTAICYPFKHKTALFGGALLYGLLLLAGFRGSFVAWMIMFGCISHVINQVAWGRLDRSFMPDFTGFNLWEDLVQPVFLGVGITIVTWGPVIALVIALLLGVISTGHAPLSAEGRNQAAQEHAPSGDELDALTDPEADSKKLEAANSKLNELHPGAQIAREAEESKAQQDDPAAMYREVLPYLKAGIALAVVLLAGIGWAIFYYPMALTVAGYTQSFGSVINPLVGLDTIRRMGSTYFKAFAMVLLVQFVSVFVGGIIGFILSPLTLPFVGNLIANFINGSVTFYFNLVIACLLGLSLFKCADRLGIATD